MFTIFCLLLYQRTAQIYALISLLNANNTYLRKIATRIFRELLNPILIFSESFQLCEILRKTGARDFILL